jgi:hypothetical protein
MPIIVGFSGLVALTPGRISPELALLRSFQVASSIWCCIKNDNPK